MEDWSDITDLYISSEGSITPEVTIDLTTTDDPGPDTPIFDLPAEKKVHIFESIDQDLVQELYYLYPDLDTLSPNDTEYTHEFFQKSVDKKFLAGYTSPNSDLRARIYSCTTTSMTVFSTTHGVIVKTHIDDTQSFDTFNQLIDSVTVFLPKGLQRLHTLDIAWYQRLLQSFIKNFYINGIIKLVSIHESLYEDTWFMCVTLYDPFDDIDKKWNDFKSGGVWLSLEVPINTLPYVISELKWNTWYIQFTPGNHVCTLFFRSLHENQKEYLEGVSLSNIPLVYHIVELSYTIYDELSVFGIAYEYTKQGVWDTIPLIGTRYCVLYTHNPPSVMYTSNLNNLDGIEIFTQESISEMTEYQKAGCIEYMNHVYSAPHVIRHASKGHQDPLTRQNFKDEFIDLLNNVHGIIKSLSIFKRFLETTVSPTLSYDIYNGYTVYRISNEVFWVVPECEYQEEAHILIHKKWHSKTLFREPYYHDHDPLLAFENHVLSFFMKSLNTVWTEPVEDRLNSEIEELSKF